MQHDPNSRYVHILVGQAHVLVDTALDTPAVTVENGRGEQGLESAVKAILNKSSAETPYELLSELTSQLSAEGRTIGLNCTNATTAMPTVARV